MKRRILKEKLCYNRNYGAIQYKYLTQTFLAVIIRRTQQTQQVSTNFAANHTCLTLPPSHIHMSVWLALKYEERSICFHILMNLAFRVWFVSGLHDEWGIHMRFVYLTSLPARDRWVVKNAKDQCGIMKTLCQKKSEFLH